MKYTIITIALAAIGFSASAQVSPYVFADFGNGTVIQKGGAKASVSLNYNTITQEMVFVQGGTKQILDPSTVDTVIIQGKKFVPSAKAFYLKLTDTKIPLYQQIANNKTGGSTDPASGVIRSAASADENVTRNNTSSADYDLVLKDGSKLQSDDKFWLEKDGKFEKADSKKDFIKAFPDKEPVIESFIKDNNIEFKKADDVVKLALFCNK